MLSRSPLKWAALIAIAITCITTLSGFLHQDSAWAATNQDQPVAPGSLQVLNKPGGAQCPLKHTDVKAEISGFLSRVTVTQEFTNPFADKIEAVYVFPLPQSAAVDDMTMLVGERTVKGKIMRREEAQAAYAAAKERGQIAGLLDQERPNIFTQAVANIMPGQEIRITISYVETLKYEEGSYEWSFPMVVGKRYIPDSDQAGNQTVPDSSRISPPRAAAGTRAGHDISIEVNLNAGVPIESLNSETHETTVERTGNSSALVRLKDLTTIPNQDFILHYQVAGNTINDAVLTHRTDRGGFFTLILQPPQRVSAEDVMPKELVFVLDTSGSMDGFPFEKARETMLLALDHLYPHDTFNVITFAGETRILFSDPVPATPDNVRKAKKFLRSHRSEGGTEMMKAIKAALEPSDSQQHVRITCFMTDGQVGNDMEIIGEVQKHPNARVFSMGFSSSPNRFLLDKMAEYGRGEVDYVSETGDTSAVARRFNERIRNPLLTDLSIDWSGLPVSDVYPKRIPDLFSAKPVILSGRYSKGSKGAIRLKGRLAGEEFAREIPIELPENETAHDVLATLWARRRIDDLMGQDMAGLQAGNMQEPQKEEITQLGLNYRLMTQFTSFVAIDELSSTGAGAPARVDVPVETFPGSITSSVSGQVTVNCVFMAGTVDPSATGVLKNSIQDLPLQGRSFQRLILLTPGTVDTNRVDASSQFNVSANGQKPTSNTFSVDGVSTNFGIPPGGQSPGASAAGTTPALTASGGTNGLVTLASADEMVIRTYDRLPEYGRMPGAEITVTTRAGTNAVHGSLFHFFGNDVFDANDWFANSRALAQPARRLNNFGGTLGGPVVKDKTFFFASYEGLRLRQPSTAITDVPAASAREAAPDAVRPFLEAFPVANGNSRPDGFAEFAAAFTNPAREDAGSLRVDHMLNNESMLTARYSFADSDATIRGANGFSLNTSNRIHSRAQTLTGSLTHTLSPTALFTVRGNYSRLRVTGSSLLDEFGGAAIAPATLTDPFTFDLNARGASWSSAGEVSNIQRQLNLVGSTSIIHGKHNLKFGADYRRLSPVINSHAREESLLFNGVAQALTGVPTRANLLTHLSPQTPVFNNLSLYAQDEWNRTSRLRLNYGLRWDVNPPPVNSGDSRLWKTTHANFAPRFGFAYNLTDETNAELTLRGGFSVLYDLGQDQAGDAFTDSLPFLGGTSVSNSPLLPATGSLPFVAFDPNLKLPYTLNWNVSLERALGAAQIISASYVASAGRRLLNTQTLFDHNPEFPFLRLVSNRGESNYNSLQLQFHRRIANGLKSMVSYTWARSTDNVTYDSARRVLLASLDPALDRGPSDFDVRHSLSGFVSYEIPALLSHGAGNKLSRNWAVDSIFSARSARPWNVLYSFPTSVGFAYVRPNRNNLRGFPFHQVDLALRRRFHFNERVSLQLQADAFNVLNHPNFEDPVGSELHRGFEPFYMLGGARTMRFSVKLLF